MDIFFITAAAVVIYGIAYLLETETFNRSFSSIIVPMN